MSLLDLCKDREETGQGSGERQTGTEAENNSVQEKHERHKNTNTHTLQASWGTGWLGPAEVLIHST